MSEDSFDSLDKNNSFYKCVNKLEDTILNNIVEHLIKRLDNIYLRQKILDISCKYYIR